MTQVLSVARRRPILVVASAVCLATALGAGLRIWFGQSQDPAIAASENPTVVVSNPDEAESFENATVSVSWRLQSLSPQYLFPSTPKSARTADIAAGRLDPYAPLSQGRPVPRPQAAPAAAVNTTPSPVSTLPPAVAAAPALPPIPTSTQPLAPLPPPLPVVAPQPVAAPTAAYASPIDSLELTGVVQVGDRPALIIREPHSTTSRYTYAGDTLAGGQILVKRIDVSNQEPLVILEYNGREYSRMVGSGPIASLR